MVRTTACVSDALATEPHRQFLYVFIYYLYIFFHMMAYKLEYINKILLLRYYYFLMNVIYIYHEQLD